MAGTLPLPFTVARRLAPPLDAGAFRLFLAMLVFVHHFTRLKLGPGAVYVFFVLSGFWLHRMWQGRYRATRAPYLTYLVSRVWRLAPVMALVSALTIALLPLLGVPMEKVAAAGPLALAVCSTVLLGYAQLPYGPIAPAWSLDIEMQFYLVAPVLSTLLLLPRTRGPMLAGALLCSLACAIAAPHAAPILPKYLAFFVLGMTCSAVAWRPSARVAYRTAGCVFAAIGLTVLSPWRDVLLAGDAPTPLHACNYAVNVVLALGCVPFAIRTTTRASDETDRMMADLSYIIYLLHWLAMNVFVAVHGSPAQRLGVAALSFVGVPALAWAIWAFYDLPINRARAKWVASRRREGIRARPRAVAAHPSVALEPDASLSGTKPPGALAGMPSGPP